MTRERLAPAGRGGQAATGSANLLAAAGAGLAGVGLLAGTTLGSPLAPEDVFATWSLPGSQIVVGEVPDGAAPSGGAGRPTGAGVTGGAPRGGAADDFPLALAAAGGRWTLREPGGTERPVDPARLVVVPGDVLVYRDTVRMSVADGVVASLSTNAAAVEGSVDWLEVAVDLTLAGAEVADGARLTAAADGAVIDVVITVTFPEEATAAQGLEADLPRLTLTVTGERRA